MNGYFDINATTPLSEAASRAWQEAARLHWHNASSLYREAGKVRHLLQEAQVSLAERLEGDEVEVEPERIVFNSGATEANNALLAYVAQMRPGKVAISAIEHPCVTDPARVLLGERLIELPVSAQGKVETGIVEDLLKRESDLALVSVMAANNECGTLQPWDEIRQLCQSYGVWYHCDAAQWLGKHPARGLGACDFVTGSAHKFGGPKGTGFLLVPEGDAGFTSLLGGPQQEGRRAGTENYPGIAGMVAALEALEPQLDGLAAEAPSFRDAFENGLINRVPGSRVVGAAGERLWNTSMFILPRESNLKWLTRLSRRGFCVSTGSACSAGKDQPSRVLLALGESYEAMGRVLRVSAGWDNARTDWEALLEALVEIDGEWSS